MSSYISFETFFKAYSTDTACLEEIKKIAYPNGITCRKCNKITIHYQLRSRPAYTCKICRTQTYPLKNTVFANTKLPLPFWFYLIFVMIKTRSGVSAKQIQRELKVSYCTAWNMMKTLRSLMGENMMLSGIVEIDETYIGKKPRDKKGRGLMDKQIVFGMVQRKGNIIMKHVQNAHQGTLLIEIQEQVKPNTTIYSDQYTGYDQLKYFGYPHDFVVHRREYVKKGKPEVHTQTIEGAWSILKHGLGGVYRHVSPKYLQTYANEFAFRYNHRKNPDEMFPLLLNKAVSKLTPPS